MRLPVFMLMYHGVQGVPEDVIMASFVIFRLTFSLSTTNDSIAEPVISVRGSLRRAGFFILQIYL